MLHATLRSSARRLALGVVLVLPVLVLPLQPARAQDVDSIYRFGLTQLEEGDIENAINTFRKVLELNPGYALAHSSLGYIYLQRENDTLALASFERALDLDSRLAAAHNGRGMVLAKDSQRHREALRSFERALELEPDYLQAHYNLGTTRTEMDDMRGAREAFEAILAIEPDFSDVHYRLGLLAIEAEDLTEAEEEFRAQYRLTPNHRENRLELGRVYFLSERYSDAENMLLPMVNQFPDFVPAMLLLADVYLAVEDYTRANQLYLMSYREFTDEETAERLWRDVVDIATDAERREYRETPLEEMTDFFRRFWRKRDFDPTNPENNSRMVEHYARLRYARQYFRSPVHPGGYDDRGRVWVKHGPPDDTVEFPAGDAETRPNISWVYWSGRDERLIIHFVDRGQGYFEQVMSLMEASERTPLTIMPEVPEGGSQPETSELTMDQIPINIYRERAIIDPMYDRIANKMEELIRNAQGAGGGVEVASVDYNQLEQMLEDEQMEVMRDVSVIESTSSYANIDPVDPLAFQFYTAAFKDMQGHTRIEVYYGVPTLELELERYGEGQRARVDLGIGMFDENWNEIVRTNEIREFQSTGSVEQMEGTVMVDMNMLRTLPGSYNFAISVTDMNSGRIGVVRDSLVVEDFAGRSLAISDIEMAGRISQRRGGRFWREGVEIIPLPTRTYTLEQEIYIYYELYNLAKDEFGTTAFQVTYSVEPADESRRQNILASAWRGLGRLVGIGRSQAVAIELDVEYGISAQENKWLQLEFDAPKPGLYLLSLTVRDLITDTEYSRTQQFMVTPAPGGDEGR